MNRWLRSLALLLIVPLTTAVPAFAAKTKTTHKSHAKKKAAPKSHPGVVKADMEARALLRKKAPFYLDQRFRSEIIRVNKDGTFSREGELGSFNSKGSWKVNKGKIVLKWNTGEEFGYRLTFNGKTPVVAGQKASKANHYVINSAD